MAVNVLSNRVRLAVFNRLSASDGVNASWQAQSQLPQYNIPVNYINFDWGPNSKNFCFGQVDPVQFEQSGNVTYPFGCLYTLESGQTNDQKFVEFSGIVRCIFEVTLSWVPSVGMQNFEVYSECLEDVVVSVLNRLLNQNWGKPLVYNGQVQCKRAQVVFGGLNFKQRVGFSMFFQVHQ